MTDVECDKREAADREPLSDALRRLGPGMRRAIRAIQGMTASARLAQDRLIRELGREWEYPESVLTDEEREAIEAQQMGRTLDEIHDLPSAVEAIREDDD